jgi:hypothetical protein
MPPASILQQIYRAHIEHFGEPDHSIVFDDARQIDGFPDRIDVLIWNPDNECDITTFATIGMASLPLPKARHRAELHFAVRKELEQRQISDVSRFLANLAMYPFQIGEPLDWWHTLNNPGEIPLFLTAKCVLLHPRFANDGWDSIVTGEGDVHILNVVPITREEKDLREISAILDRLQEVDIFEPR